MFNDNVLGALYGKSNAYVGNEDIANWSIMCNSGHSCLKVTGQLKVMKRLRGDLLPGFLESAVSIPNSPLLSM